MHALQILLIAVFPALVIVAALKDVTSYTIPNWISVVLVALYVPAALAAGLPFATIGMSLLVGAGCLAAGVAMFAVRWMGGGDAKLFAAAGLWLGVDATVPFIIATALVGGVLALVLLKLRSNLARSFIPVGPAWIERLRDPKGAAPYGVALAIGALIAFPNSALVAAVLG